MYEVSEIQDYMQKWLEAERDFILMGGELQFYPYNCEPSDNTEKDNPSEIPPSQ